MAHENRVLRSIETPDGSQCVDIFQRPAGDFGYQTYRRDAETGQGWFPTGNYDQLKFETESAALTDANQRIEWLSALL